MSVCVCVCTYILFDRIEVSFMDPEIVCKQILPGHKLMS